MSAVVAVRPALSGTDLLRALSDAEAPLDSRGRAKFEDYLFGVLAGRLALAGQAELFLSAVELAVETLRL